MKYAIHDRTILVDGQPVARLDVLPGELASAGFAELISAVNRGVERQLSGGPESGGHGGAVPGLVNDIDESGAGAFLTAHHVPIISPDVGNQLINVVKRLEIVKQIYPFPPTVEVYALALHLLLRVAAEHQRAFCAKLEDVLGESD